MKCPLTPGLTPDQRPSAWLPPAHSRSLPGSALPAFSRISQVGSAIIYKTGKKAFSFTKTPED